MRAKNRHDSRQRVLLEAEKAETISSSAPFGEDCDELLTLGARAYSSGAYIVKSTTYHVP